MVMEKKITEEQFIEGYQPFNAAQLQRIALMGATMKDIRVTGEPNSIGRMAFMIQETQKLPREQVTQQLGDAFKVHATPALPKVSGFAGGFFNRSPANADHGKRLDSKPQSPANNEQEQPTRGPTKGSK